MKMNDIIKTLIIVLVTIIFVPNVKAASCDYKKRAEMSKVAANVTASYEIKQDELGLYYYEFTIFNIHDGLFVSISESGTEIKEAPHDIFPIDTDENNSYKFIIKNIYDVVKYTFKVSSLDGECSASLRSFTITKPKYNEFSEIEECKFYGVEDLVYCQKWITNNFNLTEEGVRDKIQQHRRNNKKTVTTACISCDENDKNKEALERFYKIKKYLIIGLSIGIFADIVLILFLSEKIRKEII